MKLLYLTKIGIPWNKLETWETTQSIKLKNICQRKNEGCITQRGGPIAKISELDVLVFGDIEIEKFNLQNH